MTATKITAFAATAAVAVSALAPAVGMAKATGPGKYTVTKQAYVYKQPGEDRRRHRLQGQHHQGREALARAASRPTPWSTATSTATTGSTPSILTKKK